MKTKITPLNTQEQYINSLSFKELEELLTDTKEQAEKKAQQLDKIDSFIKVIRKTMRGKRK